MNLLVQMALVRAKINYLLTKLMSPRGFKPFVIMIKCSRPGTIEITHSTDYHTHNIYKEHKEAVIQEEKDLMG